MKISLKWLQDFVDLGKFSQRPEQLGELLTRAGLEVEEIVDRGRFFKHVVVGLILEKDKHPNADKLSVCKVTTGEGVVHQIICGAQNHKKDDRVIVALPGAELPGDFQIKRSIIRGVNSEGMLCSYKELGLIDSSDGIAILENDAPIGKLYAEYANLDDIIFELKVTPNRADCLSHFGLAREVACLIDADLKTPQIKWAGSSIKSDELISVEVLASDLCLRYCNRMIFGVQVGPSPDWLKKKIESVGLNSINNIVDVTNYVMMELGQPLHAFDADAFKSKKVVIDRASVAESFVTLAGEEIKLSGSELMIKDGDRSVCMAGVIGGQNSGVSETTKNIFLESAYFLPMSVRKSSRQHGIETDSAYRFSRGVDPDGVRNALDRATQIILKVAGGVADESAQDFYPNPLKKSPIEISVDLISERLGYQAEENKLVRFLNKLGCKVIPIDSNVSQPQLDSHNQPDGLSQMEISSSQKKIKILPPTFRFDLEGPMDLVEEYARLNGYEHIPESMPSLTSSPSSHDKNYEFSKKISTVLQGQGYLQAINFSFVSSKSQKTFLGDISAIESAGLVTSIDPICLMNPLNEESDAMRTTLIYGMTKNMVTNFHYGNEVGRLFELGSVFSMENGNYIERNRIGLMAWGYQRNLWNQVLSHELIFEVKAAIETLLQSLNLKAFSWLSLENDEEIPSFIHKGQFAQLVVEGKKIGFIGSLHPVFLEDHKVRVPAVIAEIDRDILCKSWPRPIKSLPISKMPMVERDLALIVPQKISAGNIIDSVKKSIGKTLVKIEIFDVYQGDKIEVGTKSIGLRMILQEKETTMQEADIINIQNRAIESLKKEFGITVR